MDAFLLSITHLSQSKSSSFAMQKLTFCTVIAHLLNGKIYLIENQGLTINRSFRRFLGRISQTRLTNASSLFCHQRHFCYCLMAIQLVGSSLKDVVGFGERGRWERYRQTNEGGRETISPSIHCEYEPEWAIGEAWPTGDKNKWGEGLFSATEQL